MKFRSARVAVTAALLLQSAALALPQDTYEPNNTCVAPPVVLNGVTPNLTLGPDPDYFAIDVPANAHIVIEALSPAPGTAMYDVSLFELGCGAPLATASGQALSYFDCGGAPRQLTVLVNGAGVAQAPYELMVAATEVVDDALEDNDSCQSSSLISLQDFTTPDLMVTGCDEDYFFARLLRADVQLQVDLLFDHSQGDIDLEVLEFSGGVCTGNVLASSTSTTDNESITYVNTTNPSTQQAVVVRAFMKNGEGFNSYALTACFGDASLFPLVGEQGCAGEVNATGRPATLCGIGSEVAADNSISLYVVDLPINAVGYFITAPTTGFVAAPGGSLGNLCLGAPGRYVTQVLTAAAGSVFFQPDLTAVPVAGGGSVALQPGDRQYWQFWHRDSNGGLPASNFSSSIGITFQ